MIYSPISTTTSQEDRMNHSHATSLIARHAGLDARIADESRRPSPDQDVIGRLKKQKLKIKEALAGL